MKRRSTIVLAIVAVRSVGYGTRSTHTRSRRQVGSIVRKEEWMPSKRLLTMCAAGAVTAVMLAGCGSSSSGGRPSAGGSTPSTLKSASSGTPGAGGSTPSTLKSASSGPAASEASDSAPGASPIPAEDEEVATLQAGTYVTSDPFPVSMSVTVPAGWKSEEPGPYVVFLSTAD